MEYKNIKLEWLGHASFRIKTNTGLVIYTDPYNIQGGEKADIILMTHDHYDHCDIKSINVLKKGDTAIIGPLCCAKKLGGMIKVLSQFGTISEKGVTVSAVPSYNISKPYHPKSSGYTGFIIDVSGTRIYQAGDTDRIPEMKQVKNIDIALLPIGGTFTMDAEEAAKAVSDINPKIAVPMHYGTLADTYADADYFSICVKKSSPSVDVRIL